MAEALFRRRLEQEGLTDWEVESAGTWTAGGAMASAHASQVMAERGLDLDAHRSRQIDGAMMETADLLLVMTQGHAEALRLEFPNLADKIFLLSEMKDGRRFDIADPYGRSLTHYQACVETIERLVDEGFERIRSLGEHNAQEAKNESVNDQGQTSTSP
jgi:protein-tyrosine-phosphatase